MKRRDFVTSVIVGGMVTPVLGDQSGKQGQAREDDHSGHGSHERSERFRNRKVSFGHWNPTLALPVDRFAADPNPRAQNNHRMTPSPIRVKVGDSITFAISGFHNLLIYGPGTQPQDIDKTKLIISPPAPPLPPLIDDPNHRVYRGLDPRTQPQDRVEVVGFNAPGKFLVMCGVLPHFFDAVTGQFIMFGYVEVDD